jgi:Putative transmembrane protein (PGPGW)
VDGSVETYLLLAFALSVIATVGGVVVVGIVLVKLPAGYFGASAVRRALLPDTHPLVQWTAAFLKNLLGAALVVLGLVMSVPGIPGPGIITILLGLMLLDFADKRRWAKWVISRPPILRVVNGLRRKCGKPPFVMPPARNR